MASLVSLCFDRVRDAWTKCRNVLDDPEVSQQLKSVAIGGAVAYSVLELCYYIQHRRDLERSNPRTYCAPSDTEYQNWMHDEFLDGICHEPDEAKYTLESIFGHVPANQLSRINVLQALRSHILLGHNQASLKDHIRLRALVAQLEQTLVKNHNIQFQHGYNPELRKRIRVFGGIEIRPWYKPLVVYWAVRFYRTLVTSYLRLLGFSLINKPNGISFLVKVGSDRSQPPIVFCHGLGVGVAPYFMWVRKLAQENRTVILPEMPNLSFGRYVDKYPTATEIACSIRDVVNELGFENKQVDVMGHSYGTALMTYFIRAFPHLCRRRVYVDPICFVAGAARVSQLPQAEFSQAVCVSPSHTLKHPIQFILKAIVYWFVSRDLQVQKVVLRNVWATEMFERGDQMTEDAMVLLAENDDMVPAPVIHRYLRRRWGKLVHVLYHTGTHVSFLQRPKLWDSILEFIDYGKSGRDGKNIESEHARMHNNGELPNSALEAHHWNTLHPHARLSTIDTPSSATSFSASSSSTSDADSPGYLASPPPVPHSRSMQFTVTPLHEAEQHSAPASGGMDEDDGLLTKPADKTVYQFYGAAASAAVST